MPIIEPTPAFNPTHDSGGYIYVHDPDSSKMTPYTIGKSVSTTSISGSSSTTASSTTRSELEKIKQDLAEEHEKRIRAETTAEVLKIRLENSEDNKEDDEDEISRLESELSHLKKIHRDVTFILADSAAGPLAVQGHTASSYRTLVQQILTALKQEPKKM